MRGDNADWVFKASSGSGTSHISGCGKYIRLFTDAECRIRVPFRRIRYWSCSSYEFVLAEWTDSLSMNLSRHLYDNNQDTVPTGHEQISQHGQVLWFVLSSIIVLIEGNCWLLKNFSWVSNLRYNQHNHDYVLHLWELCKKNCLLSILSAQQLSGYRVTHATVDFYYSCRYAEVARKFPEILQNKCSIVQFF